MASGLPLDHCISEGRDCDLPAALMFCQLNGWAAVVDFRSWIPAARTFIPTQNRTCTISCHTFAYIVCGRSAVAAATTTGGTGGQPTSTTTKPANATSPLTHTHPDGITHTHPGGDKPHVHTSSTNTPKPSNSPKPGVSPNNPPKPVKKPTKPQGGGGTTVTTTVVVNGNNNKGTNKQSSSNPTHPPKKPPNKASNKPSNKPSGA